MCTSVKRLAVALAFLLSVAAAAAQQSGAPGTANAPTKVRPPQQGLQSPSNLEQQVNGVLLQQSMSSAQQMTLSITLQQFPSTQSPPAVILQQQLAAVQQQLNAVQQLQQQVQALQQELNAVQLQSPAPLAALRLGVLQQQVAAASQQAQLQGQQLTAMQQQLLTAMRLSGP